MRLLSRLNGIAARIAIAIVLAMIFGLVMAVGLSIGLSSYGFREDRSPYSSGRVIIVAVVAHRNLMMLSGEIALTIRAAASVPRPERQNIIAIAAKAAPEMRITLDAPTPPEAGAAIDYNLDRLRKLVQVRLEQFSPPIAVSVHRLPVQTDRSADPDQSWSAFEQDAVVEAALPDGQSITFTIPDLPSFGGYIMPIFLGSLVFVAIFIAFWTARRLARPIREFARASERLGVDLAAPPLAVRGPQELRTATTAFNRMQERLRRFFWKTGPRCWPPSRMTCGRRWHGCGCAPN